MLIIGIMYKKTNPIIEELKVGAQTMVHGKIGHILKVKTCENHLCVPKGVIHIILHLRETTYNLPKGMK